MAIVVITVIAMGCLIPPWVLSITIKEEEKLSRDDILSELRGIDAAILTRSVDIMVSRLRQKIGDSVKPPRFIQTVWGRGYSFIGVPVSDTGDDA